ncbi:FAD/NAD(P)-binding domain-containing protein [Annulohypoxylon nitens]|nr:FAD/NAD(P)-binding domain-containing protein [Annulohypoxylon nitens]
MSTTIKARWAQRLVREKIAAELNALQQKQRNGEVGAIPQLPDLGNLKWDFRNLPPDPDYEDGKKKVGDGETPPRKVCIVGAGIAGLYIAMILDSLKIPNLTYDILEANSRVGGRVYTHHFSDTQHDYYDIGAMRFPEIPIMKRTFDLFKLTDMPLIPYYLNGPRTLDLFNDHFSDESSSDPYHVSITNGGSVKDDVVDNVGEIINGVFGPYKEKLAEDFDTGFDELKKVDDCSTREFLKRGGPNGQQTQYDFFSIQWMETLNTSTNLFDQAFSESVMDSFDFDYPESDVKWYCINGGTTLLIDAMKERLETKIETEKRVESISMDWESSKEGNMSVKCAGETDPRSGYSTVFATPALGCLARMDLRTLNLHPSHKDAIRSLHYDDSVKVALQFKYPWWIVDCGITSGGVASTDLPLRTCVYPSYNIDDDKDKPAVLLASYTWSQDANRMGSLVDQHQPPNEDELVELILQNLARLHGRFMKYEQIKELFTGVYHAYSWSHDPTTAGAFALFGPGQFSNLYPYLIRPAADSKFHIVGEAASAHHAWIVGSLESAYTAVYQFLKRFELGQAIKDLKTTWGHVEELETGEHGTVHLQIMLGKLREEDQVQV